MSLVRRGKKGIFHAIIYENGRHHYKSLKTTDLKRAQILYGEQLKEARAVTDGKVNNVPWRPLRERYLQWCRTEKSENTAETDRYKLDNLERTCVLRDSGQITPALLNDFKDKRRQAGASKSTVNRELGLLRSMAKRFQKWGVVSSSYDFRTVERYPKKELSKARRKFFEVAEIKRIQAAARQTKSRFQNLAAALILYTGMRRGEMLALKWTDIDWTNNLIHITFKDEWVAKDNEERTIPLFAPLRRVLLKYRPKDGKGYIVVRDDGVRPGGDYISRQFKKVLKAAGVKIDPETGKSEASLYSGRHTFATHMLGLVDVKMVSSMLGHASLETTGIYTQLRQDAMKEAAKKAPY